jgi:PAS domain S-box-containing protein
MPKEPIPGNSNQAPGLGNPVAPIIERSPLPIIEVQGREHLVAFVNSAFCRLLGKHRDELIGQPFAQLVFGADKCLPILDQVYETGEAATHALEDDSDPQPAYWFFAMWPALDVHERPVGVIIQLTKSADFRQNVTAVNEALLIAGLRQHELADEAEQLNVRLRAEVLGHQRTEEALRTSEERFSAIINQATAGIAQTDLAGEFVLANDRFCEITGSPRAELLHKKLPDITHPDDLPGYLAALNRLLAEGTPFICEKRYLRKDGSTIWVSETVSVIRNASGSPQYVAIISLDITERKRTEETLREARKQLSNQAVNLEQLVLKRTAELLAANKQLQTFVYSIAHDLRAPLRSMQGFSALLVEEAGMNLSGEARGYAGRINASAQFMDAMLVDLLAFSRVSQQNLEMVPVNLETVVRDALSSCEVEIHQKNSRLELPTTWPKVLAHEGTLRQVLSNLVSNALKFVAPGVAPLLRLRTEELVSTPSRPRSDPPGGPQAPTTWVRVWVEDNGIGIRPEHQNQIFALFTRLHGEAYLGTGIGLAIVLIGIERMGGRVGLHSTPGHGSRFWFDLLKA